MKYTSKYKLALRLATSPFFLCVFLVVGIFTSIKTWIMFIKYGGEHNVYDKDDIAKIGDIYQELKSKRDDKI
tara:strand:- start:723 stop:938 length:216 start_codon:yes stop_codon:yes gene_type:complete